MNLSNKFHIEQSIGIFFNLSKDFKVTTSDFLILLEKVWVLFIEIA